MELLRYFYKIKNKFEAEGSNYWDSHVENHFQKPKPPRPGPPPSRPAPPGRPAAAPSRPAAAPARPAAGPSGNRNSFSGTYKFVFCKEQLGN